jgi:hypothetical protein
MKDDATPPIAPSKRTFKFRSYPYKCSPSGVVSPLFGSDGDPTVGGSAGGGAEISIHGGQPGDAVVTITLPASGWGRTGFGTDPGYKYRDNRNVNGPITSVDIRGDRLKVRGKGPGLYSLAGAAYGSVTVRVELGARHGFCATAPAKAPATSNDTSAKFNGERNTAAGGACPPLP